MIRPTHESITVKALTTKPLSSDSINVDFNSSTLNLIEESNINADSKKSRAAKGYKVDAQHFNNESIEDCTKFLKKTEQVVIDDFIKAAKISDDNKDDESYMQAFYDLGRLMHVIQDFYAHSNWINQTGNEVKTWNESATNPKINNPEKLKTGKYNTVAEWFQKRWHEIHPSSSKKLKEGKNYDETYVETSNQSHFILNKDKSGTIADKAFEAKTGASGFDLACKDATQHSTEKWQEILKTLDEKLDDKTYQELMDDIKNFEPTVKNINSKTTEKKLDVLLKDYRINFDKKMKN